MSREDKDQKNNRLKKVLSYFYFKLSQVATFTLVMCLNEMFKKSSHSPCSFLSKEKKIKLSTAFQSSHWLLKFVVVTMVVTIFDLN
jgi:hypothetical protein